LASGSPDAGRQSKEPGTSFLSPQRSDPAADITGAEEVVYIFLTARQMAHPVARRSLIADDGFFPSSVRDDVALLVTELVTNAVRHANGDPDRAMRVELRRWADFVRVEVVGEGARFTAEGPGLVVVDRIADRWATAPTAAGACAWFEIRTGDERGDDEQRVDPTGTLSRARASVLKHATALLMEP
jgi:hypothetical protein